MKLASYVATGLAKRGKLPESLIKLIYYLLVKEEQSGFPHFWNSYFITPLPSPELYESYARKVAEIVKRLPPLVEHDPIQPSATIEELVHFTNTDAYNMAQGYYRSTDESEVPPEVKRYAGDANHKYLHGSIFYVILKYRVSIAIPESVRYESAYVLGPAGTGKTQLLQQLILNDIKTDACVIVIDSQTDLINNVKALRGIPKERLVIIDPTDVEFPIALNIFDVGQDRLAQFSKLDYERHINGVIDLLSYVISSILNAELTQRQGTSLNFVLRLLINIPGATIHTLCDILAPKGLDDYKQYLPLLSLSAQKFFQTEFNSKPYDEVKGQVLRRLYGLLENPTIERLFSNPKSRVNIKKEMDAGKIILINTSKELLKSGCGFFGRFFLSLISQAALERARQAPDDRHPTFVYIDECHDYVDKNIGDMLAQNRKYKVALTLAHQQVDQLPADVKASVFTNTSTKYLGAVSAADARALADDMRTSPEQLRNQKKLNFSLYVRGYLSSPVTMKVTPGLMEREPSRTAREKQELLDYTRRMYSVSTEEEQHEPEPEEEEEEEQEEVAEDAEDEEYYEAPPAAPPGAVPLLTYVVRKKVKTPPPPPKQKTPPPPPRVKIPPPPPRVRTPPPPPKKKTPPPPLKLLPNVKPPPPPDEDIDFFSST